MKMYRVYLFGNPNIVISEIKRATNHYVWRDNIKVAKRSNNENYFLTWEEAREFLLFNALRQTGKREINNGHQNTTPYGRGSGACCKRGVEGDYEDDKTATLYDCIYQ